MSVSSRTVWAVMAVAAGAGLAAIYLPKNGRLFQQPDSDDSRRVDEASEDSFPASDPPSFSAPTVGPQAADPTPLV
jgi:hypothetical protein